MRDWYHVWGYFCRWLCSSEFRCQFWSIEGERVRLTRTLRSMARSKGASRVAAASPSNVHKGPRYFILNLWRRDQLRKRDEGFSVYISSVIFFSEYIAIELSWEARGVVSPTKHWSLQTTSVLQRGSSYIWIRARHGEKPAVIRRRFLLLFPRFYAESSRSAWWS